MERVQCVVRGEHWEQEKEADGDEHPADRVPRPPGGNQHAHRGKDQKGDVAEQTFGLERLDGGGEPGRPRQRQRHVEQEHDENERAEKPGEPSSAPSLHGLILTDHRLRSVTKQGGLTPGTWMRWFVCDRRTLDTHNGGSCATVALQPPPRCENGRS